MITPAGNFIWAGLMWVLNTLGIGSVGQLLYWIVLFAAAIWLIKRIFRIGSRRKHRKSDEYWLNKAQTRQQIRFDNATPPIQNKAQPLKKGFWQKRNERKGKSANGWTFNEETQLWEPPRKLRK